MAATMGDMIQIMRNYENESEKRRRLSQQVRRRPSDFWGYFKIDKFNQKETNRTSKNGLLPTKKEKKCQRNNAEKSCYIKK